VRLMSHKLGKIGLQEKLIPFQADDGHACSLLHVRGTATPFKGPVLLVHGAGVRARIFQPPLPTTFVDALLADGYDVWLENWRASIDLPPNEWTLDQAARYDHPAAVRKVLELTQTRQLKVVVHCQGSTSLMLSLAAGWLPQVSTVVSNAVSLHPVVSRISLQKSRYAVPLVSKMTKYLDPRWGVHAPGLVPKLLQTLVKLTHHECDNAVCKFSSFTYGTGFPVLWRHENLSAAVHDWISGEFGPVPMSFFRQMRLCLNAGHLVPSTEHGALLPSPLLDASHITARVAFVAGELNHCFSWNSQARSHAWLSSAQPDRGHSVQIFKGYGHLDVFLGTHAARDTYPTMLAELNK
jgi:pimeloyl-ACP methyl ester carboxylesterase